MPVDSLSIIVPIDPADGSINLYLRSTRKGSAKKGGRKAGGHFKPARLVKFREALADAWRKAAKGQPIHGRLVLSIDCYYKRQSHVDPNIGDLAFGDADSPVKAIQDSIMDAGIIVDDVLVVRVESEKHLDRKRPRVEARLSVREPT